MTAPAPNLSRLLAVVRDNRDYRRLFAANAVSLVGDSFNTVALLSLLLELTGTSESVALVLVARLMPMFLTGPIAGVIADRFSRRLILVACDLARAGVVACLLLVRRPEQAPLAYALIAVHAVLSAMFEPAQQAVFPDLVAREDLVVASAIDNSLWSIALAVGSALGGVVMLAVGRNATFLVDAASFLASAYLLQDLPARVARSRHPTGAVGAAPGWRRLARLSGLADFWEGVRQVAHDIPLRSLIAVKGGFGLTLSGVLVLLAYFGEKVLSQGSGRGIAILWMARGVGSFVGPLLAWRVGGDSPAALRRGITLAFVTVGVSYVLFSQLHTLLLASLVLAVANAGGSILWTYAASLQQMLVADAFRGRFFAADMGFMTLTMSLSTMVVGRALDAGVAPALLMAACGLTTALPIALWTVAQRGFPTPVVQRPPAPPATESAA